MQNILILSYFGQLFTAHTQNAS